MKKACGCIRASAACPIRFSVCSLAMARQTTKSERAKQIVERHMPDAGVADGRKGIGDQNLHAQHLGDPGQIAADAAIADDAEAAAGQLPAHDDLGLAPGMVVRGRARNAARQIDHEAERELRDRLHEAGTGPRHQHAGGGSGFDIDVADIDGAADEGAQLWQRRKDLARPRREPVGDDDIDVARRPRSGRPHPARRRPDAA